MTFWLMSFGLKREVSLGVQVLANQGVVAAPDEEPYRRHCFSGDKVEGGYVKSSRAVEKIGVLVNIKFLPRSSISKITLHVL